MYRRRQAEKTVGKLGRMFGAVLVSGPRQVGKTTLLTTVTEGMRSVTLDDLFLRDLARERTGTFFKDNPPPVFVDEVQKEPALFGEIKLLLDRSRKKGQFFLCGSQPLHLMKGVSESLSGRVGLLTLLGYSLRERTDCGFDQPFVPTDDYFDARRGTAPAPDYDGVWAAIHRGAFPELVENPDFDWSFFYAAYVRTYVERDVRELAAVGDELQFVRFLTACAAMTGSLLNLTSLARDVGVGVSTAQRWLSILTASNLVYLLQPYSNNALSRAVKTPKLYFLDTGLAAYLTRWTSPGALKDGAMGGALFETFVVSEIVKSYLNAGVTDPPLAFYRDRDRREIDLIIESDGVLHPIEIKKHADPRTNDVKAFDVLDRIPGKRRGPGGVVCLYDRLASIGPADRVIPVGWL